MQDFQQQKKKLHLYVDETGQDTKGQLFLVSVVISEDHYALGERLSRIEQKAKAKKKWSKSNIKHRLSYIEKIVAEPFLSNSIFYAFYERIDRRTYGNLTASTIAETIRIKAVTPYTATIFVDGLRRSERLRFGRELRQLGVRTRKVRGIRDEADSRIRLADAIAGFARDYKEAVLEKQSSAYATKIRRLYQRAVRANRITEITKKAPMSRGRSLFSVYRDTYQKG